MAVLKGSTVLLVFQLLGEALRAGLHVPMPGPVLGMALLAAWYVARRREPGRDVQAAADGLLGWLPLLFVPAGVGVFANLALLRAEWLPISVGLAGSSLLTLTVTAWVMQAVTRRRRSA